MAASTDSQTKGLRGEAKAEASLASLQSMMKNTTRVRRDSEAVEVDAEQLVPGDIGLMEADNICTREPGKRVKSKA